MRLLRGLSVLISVALIGAVGLLLVRDEIRLVHLEFLKEQMRFAAPSAETRAALGRDVAEAGFDWGAPVFIRIFKHESELEVWIKRAGRFELFRAYPVCRWSGWLGPKLKQGDRQTPEGFYRVARGQLNPASAHHLSFDLGFPNAFDRAHGRTGAYLMVHGGCSSAGCYAMTDRGVDDIYRLVEAALKGGQAAVLVHAFPFRMTDFKRTVLGLGNEEWHDFWDNLAEGYHAFEATRLPPEVRVVDGRYQIDPVAGTVAEAAAAAPPRMTKR
jgi:murein L,D-transpeptidase YafK